uniref:Post-SET domain-containing protein n=1 Tax=Anopheles coluzzii TaxID=1518534 RepID=A0A6E8VTJ6_ANOCL
MSGGSSRYRDSNRPAVARDRKFNSLHWISATVCVCACGASECRRFIVRCRDFALFTQ